MNREERAAWGPLIREARTSQGLTQEQLAEQVGLTRRTIHSMESGKFTPTRTSLDAVLEALGLQGEQPRLDTDVDKFLGVLGVLLQRLTPEQREVAMPAMVEIAIDPIGQSGKLA